MLQAYQPSVVDAAVCRADKLPVTVFIMNDVQDAFDLFKHFASQKCSAVPRLREWPVIAAHGLTTKSFSTTGERRGGCAVEERRRRKQPP